MQLNLKSLIFLILIAGLVLTGCGGPALLLLPRLPRLRKRLLRLPKHLLLNLQQPRRSLLNCGRTMAILVRPRHV
jgi:hypothetical protein